MSKCFHGPMLSLVIAVVVLALAVAAFPTDDSVRTLPSRSANIPSETVAPRPVVVRALGPMPLRDTDEPARRGVLLSNEALTLVDLKAFNQLAEEVAAGAYQIAELQISESVHVHVEFRAAKVHQWQSRGSAGAYTLTGRLLGQYNGYVVVQSHSEGVKIRLQADRLGTYEIVPMQSPIHVARQVSASERFQCLVDAAGMEPFEGQGYNGLLTGLTSSSECTGDCDDGCIIDIIVLYTEEAEKEEGDVQLIAEGAILDANQAFEQSLVNDGASPSPTPLKFRIVYLGKIEDFDETTDCGCSTPACVLDELSNPYTTCEPLQFLAPMRDALRADMVALVTRTYHAATGTFIHVE